MAYHYESIHILIADDDDDDRQFFNEALEELKIKTTVEMVTDGAALLRRLAKKNAVLPQILFLDLNMPFKNGIECLAEIKKNRIPQKYDHRHLFYFCFRI